MPHPNEFVACLIASLPPGILAGLAGSDHPEDAEALQLDWLEEIWSPEAPPCTDWQTAWEWYSDQLAARYPGHVRLELTPEPVRVASVD